MNMNGAINVFGNNGPAFVAKDGAVITGLHTGDIVIQSVPGTIYYDRN
jgi:hypothetical protein